MTIVKRDGTRTNYDGEKIKNAMRKAMNEGSGADEKLIDEIEREIREELENEFHQGEFTVENASDLIEDKLMAKGKFNTARRYIKYRAEHENNRNKKWEMTDLQYDIWSQKYEHDDEGFEGFLERVSGGNKDIKKLIRDKKFIFGGRILAGRGLNYKGIKTTYSNCYVLPEPKDNLESIFDTAKNMARTFSYGGGVGINIGKLRPRGSKVHNSAKETTGAVSFMDLYSMVTGLIGQNNRRGALMISIPSNHPDLEEFINIKSDLSKVTKANISIMLYDEFMESVWTKSMYKLTFMVEDTGEVIEKVVDADRVFTMLAKLNWSHAEPGALYWSTIENYHLMSNDPTFKYTGVNPCAEEPLPENGACLLGSINLSAYVKNKFTKDAYFDFEEFKKDVMIATVGLNEVLDEGIPFHPLKEQGETARDLRQIGLGLMGYGDMLIMLGLQYGSTEAINFTENIAKLMINSALQQSALLAKEFGAFPKYNAKYVLSSKFLNVVATTETFNLIEKYGLRNSQVLTSAPTGSISTMWGITGGIEPIYQISYTRKTETLNDGETYYKVFTPIAREYMELNNIKHQEDLPNFFVTAMTLNWKDRVDTQAVWQTYIDASISSTVNLPEYTTVDEVKELYIYAWQQGLKGITIFRDGCERAGILTSGDTKKQPQSKDMSIEELQDLIYVKAQEKLKLNPNTCPMCGGGLIHAGGCTECTDCGYSPCSL